MKSELDKVLFWKLKIAKKKPPKKEGLIYY